MLSSRGQDVRGEPAGVLHRGQGVRRLVDAHERQGRIDRDGAKSAHGEASRLVVIAECGQDDHPARKAGHDLPEPGGLDHDGIVVGEVVKNTCLQLWKRLTCLLVGHVLDLFSPPVRDWFRASFAEPTAVQEQGWREVGAGRHVLMAAPTGSGKTLAAFLWCLDRLSGEPTPAEAERCRVLYVSPLKALAHDDPILHNDGTHQRVWPYLTFAFGRECQSQIQETETEIAVRLSCPQR